jgi:hypothetical protein
MTTQRILSLDGGGTWALVQVAALTSIYGSQTTGREVLRDFDLVVANSGGALVVAALFEDFTLERIGELFNDSVMLGRLFDAKSVRGMRGWLHWFPRYQTRAKLGMLEEFCPSAAKTKMSEVCSSLGGRTNLLLVSFDYDTQRAVFTRSNAGSLSQAFLLDVPHQLARELSVADAVHGSSTPPVRFFDQPALTGSPRSRRLWDGALGGYNNPVVAGICELLAHPEVRPEAIEVLSIGTGQVRLFSHRTAELLRSRDPACRIPAAAIATGGDPLRAPYFKRTMRDLEKLAMTILDDPPDAATYVAFMLLGHKPPCDAELPDLRLVRMNPVLCPIREGDHWSLPTSFADPKQVARLAELDLDAHEPGDVELIAAFTRAWLYAKHAGELPNQGIRQQWDSSLDFGDPTFEAAKRRWQALRAAS